MVGIKSIILIISLGSYLVAFVNACIGDNELGCVVDGNATTQCCNDTSLCFYDGTTACIAACGKNDDCPEEYNTCLAGYCQRNCSTNSDCDSGWNCFIYFNVCVPCRDAPGGSCYGDDACCGDLVCKLGQDVQDGTCQSPEN